MATSSFEAFGFGASGYDPLMSFAEGSLNDFFGKKSEKRAYERQVQLMRKQYQYAQRYAENSPSWTVSGLRNAGLNPILAVSNGANFTSTIPSAPSVTSYKADTGSQSRGGFRYDPLTHSQLKVNDATIRNLDSQAEAAKLNSISQAKEREANTALRLLEAEQRKGSNFQHPLVRDADSLFRRLSDSVKDSLSVEKDVSAFIQDDLNSYINHGPKATSSQVRHAEIRAKREEQRERNSYWKTRRTFDGKPVYRKRGDVGGNIHMYR